MTHYKTSGSNDISYRDDANDAFPSPKKQLVVASIIVQIRRVQICPPEIDDWRSPAMRSAATWPRPFVLCSPFMVLKCLKS